MVLLIVESGFVTGFAEIMVTRKMLVMAIRILVFILVKLGGLVWRLNWFSELLVALVQLINCCKSIHTCGFLYHEIVI